MEEELLALAMHRLEESKDSLEEARILLKEGKTRGAMNRVYYTMFYRKISSGRITRKICIFFRRD